MTTRTGRRRRILAVEDSRTQAEAMQSLLSAEGYEVTVAASGEAALVEFNAPDHAFDIVVSDIVMPGTVDGYELCRRIKTGSRGETPVILLTSLTDPLDIINGLESGADNFIPKPYLGQHLLERISDLLDTRTARRESKIRMGVQVYFMGRQFTISSDREQILDLLISTFEDAVRQNRELRLREVELQSARDALRQQANQELQASEERYRLVFERHPQPLWVFDLETLRFLAVNEAAIRLYGYSRDEFLGMTIEAIRPPEDVPVLRDALTRISGRADPDIWRHKKKDGTLLEVEIAGNAVDFLGRPARLVSAVDRTERNQARRSLEARARQQAAVADLGEVAVAASELSTLFEAACSLVAQTLAMEVCEILELQPSHAVLRLRAGVGWREGYVGHTTVPASPESQAGHALVNNEPVVVEDFALESRFRVHDSHREHGVVSGACVVIRVHTGAFGVLGAHTIRPRSASPDDIHFLQAVAHIIGAAIDRDRAETAQRQNQRLESVGRLAGGIAHDFNNILTAIMGEADLALPEVTADSLVRQSLTEIRTSAQRAADLTRQLLAFSRRQVVHPVVVSINEVVQGAEKMLRRLIGDDVRLLLRLAPDPGTTLADRGQLEQVLMNLVVNARDAMPTGGSITIETSATELDEQHTHRHPDAAPGSYVLLAVTDTGMGISPDALAHVFEPFFTTKESGLGTGLGLSTCYGIVKQGGGHIAVNSEIGVGTTFRVYLPLTSQPPRPSAATVPVTSYRGTETVLLVEDSPLVRKIAARALASLGYRVLEAGSAEEALMIADQRGATLDLVITDLVLPRMSGRELAERLAERRGGFPIVFTTGYTDDVVFRRKLLAEDAHFVPKPFTIASLGQKVRQVLDEAKRTLRDSS